jgi:LemA protein
MKRYNLQHAHQNLPNSLFAGGVFDKEKAYFTAVEGAETPVEVKF